jgi:hypothetical protein
LSALAAWAAAGTLGCASAAPPPGGPEDQEPPRLVRVTPDSNALNVRDRDVSFFFDETINDRGSGAQEVGNYFLVSPSDGVPEVSWRRSRIDVRPRNGFRPNTAYSVTLLPGLADLRGNAMRTGASVVFSTGPTIPPDRITGTVFDWAAERPAARALMQALTPDSIVYLAQSDSIGRFTVGPLPRGRYLVRAIIDQNGNRALDRNEPFDSLTVLVPQSGALELRAAQRDTLPPRLLTVASIDSITLRATFDRLVDPTQKLAPEQFRLAGADSVLIPVARVLTPREELEAMQAAQQAQADSVRRADSLAGKVLGPPTRPARRTTPALPTPSVPAPFTSVSLKLARPLAPSTPYRLSVTGVRGLTARTQPSERSFTTPKPPPPLPAPPARAAPDSTRATPVKRP